MQWHYHYKDEENAGLYNCFEGMKGEGGERRRVGGLVMEKMKMFEQLRVMHEPVREVEIGIVHYEHGGEGKPKPKQAMIADVLVVLRVLPEGREQTERRHSSEYDYCEEGGAYLAPVVIAGRHAALYLFVSDAITDEFVPYQPKDTRYNNIA